MKNPSTEKQAITDALKRVTMESVYEHGVLLAIWYACGKGSAEDQDDLFYACVMAVAATNEESEISFGRIQERLYG